MLRLSVLFTALAALSVAPSVNADLPIHCLRHQVEGRWKFHVGKWSNTPFPKCESFRKDDAAHTVHVDLADPSSSAFSKNPYTLVYDEGFNVVMNVDGEKAVAFAFFKWRKLDNGLSESFCGLTAPKLAWVNDGIGVGAPKKWACMIGEKVEQPKPTTFPANPDLLLAETPEEMAQLERRAAEQLAGARRGLAMHPNRPEDPEDIIEGIYEERHVQNTSRAFDPNEVMTHDKWQNLVDEINKEESSWHAKVYPHLFVGKTRRELEQMGGGRLYNPFKAIKNAAVSGNKIIHGSDALVAGKAGDADVFDDEDSADGDDDDDESDDSSDDSSDDNDDEDEDDAEGDDEDDAESRRSALDVSGGDNAKKALPRHWDWRKVKNSDGTTSNYLTHRGINQGSCGSCFAIATTRALSSRARILTKNKWRVSLSPQYALDCSNGQYAQGCDGGFPFALSKWIHDNGGIPSEECSEYEGKGGRGCRRSCRKIVASKNFRYIGGAFGQGGDLDAIWREVYERGPIPVALEVGNDFMSYSGGIFDGHLHKKLKRTKEDHFEITNHAVLLIGFGTDSDGTKYHLIANSWGDDWGENGTIRMKAGVDLGHIESMAVTLDAHILDRDWSHYNSNRN